VGIAAAAQMRGRADVKTTRRYDRRPEGVKQAVAGQALPALPLARAGRETDMRTFARIRQVYFRRREYNVLDRV